MTKGFVVAERDPQPAGEEIWKRTLNDRQGGGRHREAMAMAIAATVRTMAGRVMALGRRGGDRRGVGRRGRYRWRRYRWRRYRWRNRVARMRHRHPAAKHGGENDH